MTVATVKRARLHISTAINVCRHLKPGKKPPLPAGKKKQQLTWISSRKMQLQTSTHLKSVCFPMAFIEHFRAQDSTAKATHGHQRFGEQLLLTSHQARV